MGKDVPRVAGQVLPEIVQVTGNLTARRVAEYFELGFPRQVAGTRLVMEVLNVRSDPEFLGRADGPWRWHRVASSVVLAVSPKEAPLATTAGLSLFDPRDVVIFMATVSDLPHPTASRMAHLMAEVKRRYLREHRDSIWGTYTALAPKVYRSVDARVFGQELDQVLYRIGHVREGVRGGVSSTDAQSAMVLGALEDLHRSVLERRPVIGPERSLHNRLVEEVRRAYSSERPPIDFIGTFVERDGRGEEKDTDAVALRLAQIAHSGATMDDPGIDTQLLRWFCEKADLNDLEQKILMDRYKDPEVPDTALKRRHQVDRKTVWLARQHIRVKAEILGLREMIRD